MLASNLPTSHRDDGEQYYPPAHRIDRDWDEYCGEPDEVDLLMMQIIGPRRCVRCGE